MFCFGSTSDGNSEGNSGDERNIQGVMRTGLFASGLLVAGEAIVQLVLLTAIKPTITVLHKIVKCLSDELPVRILSSSCCRRYKLSASLLSSVVMAVFF